jgi:hypothetical protein
VWREHAWLCSIRVLYAAHIAGFFIFYLFLFIISCAASVRGSVASASMLHTSLVFLYAAHIAGI